MNKKFMYKNIRRKICGGKIRKYYQSTTDNILQKLYTGFLYKD